MIKRRYFMSVKINHLDGKLSYSWHYSCITVTSWFANSSDVFEYMRKDAIKLAEKKGYSAANIEVVSFNRY